MFARFAGKTLVVDAPTNRRGLAILEKLPAYSPAHWSIERHEGGNGVEVMARWETEEGPRAFAQCLRTTEGIEFETPDSCPVLK